LSDSELEWSHLSKIFFFSSSVSFSSIKLLKEVVRNLLDPKEELLAVVFAEEAVAPMDLPPSVYIDWYGSGSL
jgi:hypothetical protein